MSRILAICLFAAALLAGCGKPAEEVNQRTPEQQKQADKLYDMGDPTDRSKSKGY